MKTESTLVWLLTLSLMVHLTGCGSGSAAPAQPAVAQAPSITSISPSNAVAGGSQFTLTVNGANFVSGAVVTWEGYSRTTAFISSTQLTAIILASDIATGGYALVSVINPPPSGPSSNAVAFHVIGPPAPAISSLAPSSATAGAPQFTLMVRGQFFGPDSVVTWNGSARATAFVSDTQISATILASDIAASGTANVAVLNPPNSVSNGFAFGITAVGAPKFASTGNMIRARAAHTATLLPSGKVLVVDGGQLDIDDLLVPTASAELFDPSPGSFASTGLPLVTRENHTATLLLTGKVLITGGNENGSGPSATAELYDPATGMFAQTGNMAVGRTQHTASLLADGRVLVVGGSTDVGSGTATTTVTLASAEIYDPGTGTFAAAGNMASSRAGHTATVLPSGKVLITGGQNDQTAQATAELYDPQTNSFTETGSMAALRTGHTAALLINGKVLVAGGATSKALYSGGISPAVPPQTTAELYDPLTEHFAATASMAYGRIAHTATVLPNGTVLISGGFNDYSPSAGYESYNSAEIYDPAAGSFINTSPMSTGRFWHSATLLPSGAVLISGGIGGDMELASAEIFK